MESTNRNPVAVVVNDEDETLRAQIRAILADLPSNAASVVGTTGAKSLADIMRRIPKDRVDLLERMYVAHFAWLRRCFHRASVVSVQQPFCEADV